MHTYLQDYRPYTCRLEWENKVPVVYWWRAQWFPILIRDVIIFILKTSILLRLEKARWRLEKQVSDNTEVLQVLDLTDWAEDPVHVYGVWWEMADSVSKSELEKFETFIGIYTTPNTQWFTGEMCFRVVHVVQFRPKVLLPPTVGVK